MILIIGRIQYDIESLQSFYDAIIRGTDLNAATKIFLFKD